MTTQFRLPPRHRNIQKQGTNHVGGKQNFKKQNLTSNEEQRDMVVSRNRLHRRLDVKTGPSGQ